MTAHVTTAKFLKIGDHFCILSDWDRSYKVVRKIKRYGKVYLYGVNRKKPVLIDVIIHEHLTVIALSGKKLKKK
jgi:hypothetical protein